MRVALWFLGLFGVAVALALFAGNNQGTVTLFWPPYRIDVSLNLALLVLLALFLVVHLALRALAVLFELPQRARRWRVQQKERALLASLVDATAQMLAGRFVRARKAAQMVLVQEQALVTLGEPLEQAAELRAVAHVLVAESAQALQDRPVRDEHLALARSRLSNRMGAVAQGLREGLALRLARWTLDDRDPAGALSLLAELPQGVARRTLALRIRLKAARLARQTAVALDTARLLAKHRAFSPEAARSIVRGLALDLIQGAHDTLQVQRAWASLDDSERKLPDVAIGAATRLMVLGGDTALARSWLTPVWEVWTQAATQDQDIHHEGVLTQAQQIRLVRALELSLDSLDSTWLGRIEQTQLQVPGHAALQYLAGMACMKRQLWGKSQQLLNQAAQSLRDPELRRRACVAMALLAAERGDTDGEYKAWKEAARDHDLEHSEPEQRRA